MKEFIKKLPFIGRVATALYRKITLKDSPTEIIVDSKDYWERRYSDGGNSGAGSYGKFAMFKAQVINSFVAENDVKSVIEFGCGDGNQLELAEYPSYTGFDVSETAVFTCRDKFGSDETKCFRLMEDYKGERADLTLSLDVIYHLLENNAFEGYMKALFNSADRYVIIYSSNFENNPERFEPHVRHRRFTDWVAANCPDWKMKEHVPNIYPYHGDHSDGSFADFYIYEKR